ALGGERFLPRALGRFLGVERAGLVRVVLGQGSVGDRLRVHARNDCISVAAARQWGQGRQEAGGKPNRVRGNRAHRRCLSDQSTASRTGSGSAAGRYSSNSNKAAPPPPVERAGYSLPAVDTVPEGWSRMRPG